MTSLPYIDPRPVYNEPAFLRVSNPRETGETIHFRVGLQKKTNSELRPKEANLLASSSALLFTAAGDLPQIPKASGKKRPTEASSPKPKPALIIERDEALVAEREAKRKLNTLRKALTRANTESVLQTIAAQKRRDVRQVRRAQEERTGSLLSKQFAKKVSPATAEEQNELGVLLLSAFAWVEPDPKARGWYKLYKHMDIDGDGRISYYELEALIRTLLRVPHEQYSDEKLQAVWLSADTDQSGWWSSTEFGKMMRKAEDELRRRANGGVAKGGTDSGSSTSQLNPSSPLPALPRRSRKKKDDLSPEMIAIKERAEFASRAAVEEIRNNAERLEAESQKIEKQLTVRTRKLNSSVSLPALGTQPPRRDSGTAKPAETISFGGETSGALPPIS